MSIPLDVLAKTFPEWRNKTPTEIDREEAAAKRLADEVIRERNGRVAKTHRQTVRRQQLDQAKQDRAQEEIERAERKRAQDQQRQLAVIADQHRCLAAKLKTSQEYILWQQHNAWVREQVTQYAAVMPRNTRGRKAVLNDEKAVYRAAYGRWYRQHRDEVLRRKGEIRRQCG